MLMNNEKVQKNNYSYKNRVLDVLKDRLTVYTQIFIGVTFSLVVIISFIFFKQDATTVICGCLGYLFVIFILIFFPAFVEAKCFFLSVEKEDMHIIIRYMKYNKLVIFKDSLSNLECRTYPEERKGFEMHSSIVVKRKSSFFSSFTSLKFYEVLGFKKEVLLNAFV